MLQVRLVVQPPSGHRARDEVLDQDVRVVQQGQQDVAAGRLGQVQPDGALAAVDRREIGGVAIGVDGRTQGACLVAARWFDLDHVRALVGQHLAAQGARQHPGEINDAQALQRAPGGGDGGGCSMFR
ncbi:hypothetical protein D3C85_1251920 [compost metagenome]